MRRRCIWGEQGYGEASLGNPTVGACQVHYGFGIRGDAHVTFAIEGVMVLHAMSNALYVLAVLCLPCLLPQSQTTR